MINTLNAVDDFKLRVAKHIIIIQLNN